MLSLVSGKVGHQYVRPVAEERTGAGQARNKRCPLKLITGLVSKGSNTRQVLNNHFAGESALLVTLLKNFCMQVDELGPETVYDTSNIRPL